MGKTIMLSALIQTNRKIDTSEEVEPEVAKPSTQPRIRLDSKFKSVTGTKPRAQSSATLIVAPTSLLNQWSEELERSCEPGVVKTIVWHGNNRLDLGRLQGRDDKLVVVITSYGVLASEHAKVLKSGSTVFDGTRLGITTSMKAYISTSVEWLRVVLDEAHHCKSRNSKTAKAVCALKARRRWAVTGML
jgi:DNA repair protein RAD5